MASIHSSSQCNNNDATRYTYSKSMWSRPNVVGGATCATFFFCFEGVNVCGGESCFLSSVLSV